MNPLFPLLILSSSCVSASDIDVRVEVMRRLVSQLDPKAHPQIAIVKDTCESSKSFVRFSRDELRSILDGSKFDDEHLVPVNNVLFPDSENPGFRDSQSGLNLHVISITYITHRENRLYVNYMIDSGLRKPGFNYPSDGNYEAGSFRITFEGNAQHFEHIRYWDPDRELPN